MIRASDKIDYYVLSYDSLIYNIIQYIE